MPALFFAQNGLWITLRTRAGLEGLVCPVVPVGPETHGFLYL